MKGFLVTGVALLIASAHVLSGASAGQLPVKSASGPGSSRSSAETQGRKTQLVHLDERKEPRSRVGYCISGGVPVRKVAELVSAASSILRGTVRAVEEVGDGVLAVNGTEYDVRVRHAVIDIISVVKGDASQAGATVIVEFYTPFAGPPWAQLQTGHHGLIFLADDGAPSDLYHLLLPVAPDAPSPPGDLSPIDEIKQYLLLSIKPGVTEATLESCIDAAADQD